MKTTTIAAIGVVLLVLLGIVVAPAMAANADNGLYTSKYAAPPADAQPTKGTLKGILRAGFALDQTIIVYGPETVKITVGDDGRFEADLIPGNYTIVLADGNGGQVEFSSASIVAGQISFPEREILGHAITPKTEATPDVIEIIDAQYGAIVQRERTVVDTEAWTETIQVPAVTHQQWVVDCPAQPAVPAHGHPTFDYMPGHVHAKMVNPTSSSHDFVYNGDKYQITGSRHDDAFIVHAGTPAVPEQGHYVTVIDVPAHTHTINHPAETHVEVYNYGQMVDVTAAVQAAVDAGNRDGLVFDNGQNPGGLFVDGVLFQQIQDPAVGIVKDVVINYKLNGVDKTITTKEYQEITI